MNNSLEPNQVLIDLGLMLEVVAVIQLGIYSYIRIVSINSLLNLLRSSSISPFDSSLLTSFVVISVSIILLNPQPSIQTYYKSRE